MVQEIINDKQAVFILILFVCGNSLLFESSAVAKNDAWFATFIAMLAALPMVLIYARLLSLFRGKDIFEIMPLVLGKFLGKFFVIVLTWYAFHLSSLVLRTFGEFLNTITMPETPMIVSLFLVGILCIMAVRGGIETLGRSAKFFLPYIIALTTLVILLGLPQMQFHYLKPILHSGFKPIIKGAFETFSFPLVDTVILTVVYSALQPRTSPFKVFVSGLFIGGMVLLITNVTNALMLGADVVAEVLFASHTAVSMIHLGTFIQRIEVGVAAVFVVGTFIKTSVCLLAACKGMSRIFGLKDYRVIVTQMGLLMIYFSYFIFSNISEFKEWIKIYPFYAFPFQVIIPVILWIVAEIRTGGGKRKLKQA